MNPELRVAVDVGVSRHRVAVGLSEGVLLEEFEIGHDTAGLAEFFARVGRHERRLHAQVAVAMEGYNGHARPLDQQVLARGYRLFNVNNLKLARYKEIFPGPAKSDPIDTRKIFELFALKDKLPLAREVLQEVAPVAPVDAQLKALAHGWMTKHSHLLTAAASRRVSCDVRHVRATGVRSTDRRRTCCGCGAPPPLTRIGRAVQSNEVYPPNHTARSPHACPSADRRYSFGFRLAPSDNALDRATGEVSARAQPVFRNHRRHVL